MVSHNVVVLVMNVMQDLVSLYVSYNHKTFFRRNHHNTFKHNQRTSFSAVGVDSAEIERFWTFTLDSEDSGVGR
jgi:hypothetical protein